MKSQKIGKNMSKTVIDAFCEMDTKTKIKILLVMDRWDENCPKRSTDKWGNLMD